MPTMLSRLFAAALLALTLAPNAFADDYPNRPVRLIVPFPPGGSNDVVAIQSTSGVTNVATGAVDIGVIDGAHAAARSRATAAERRGWAEIDIEVGVRPELTRIVVLGGLLCI